MSAVFELPDAKDALQAALAAPRRSLWDPAERARVAAIAAPVITAKSPRGEAAVLRAVLPAAARQFRPTRAEEPSRPLAALGVLVRALNFSLCVEDARSLGASCNREQNLEARLVCAVALLAVLRRLPLSQAAQWLGGELRPATALRTVVVPSLVSLLPPWPALGVALLRSWLAVVARAHAKGFSGAAPLLEATVLKVKSLAPGPHTPEGIAALASLLPVALNGGADAGGLRFLGSPLRLVGLIATHLCASMLERPTAAGAAAFRAVAHHLGAASAPDALAGDPEAADRCLFASEALWLVRLLETWLPAPEAGGVAGRLALRPGDGSRLSEWVRASVFGSVLFQSMVLRLAALAAAERANWAHLSALFLAQFLAGDLGPRNAGKHPDAASRALLQWLSTLAAGSNRLQKDAGSMQRRLWAIRTLGALAAAPEAAPRAFLQLRAVAADPSFKVRVECGRALAKHVMALAGNAGLAVPLRAAVETSDDDNRARVRDTQTLAFCAHFFVNDHAQRDGAWAASASQAAVKLLAAHASDAIALEALATVLGAALAAAAPGPETVRALAAPLWVLRRAPAPAWRARLAVVLACDRALCAPRLCAEVLHALYVLVGGQRRLGHPRSNILLHPPRLDEIDSSRRAITEAVAGVWARGQLRDVGLLSAFARVDSAGGVVSADSEAQAYGGLAAGGVVSADSKAQTYGGLAAGGVVSADSKTEALADTVGPLDARGRGGEDAGMPRRALETDDALASFLSHERAAIDAADGLSGLFGMPLAPEGAAGVVETGSANNSPMPSATVGLFSPSWLGSANSSVQVGPAWSGLCSGERLADTSAGSLARAREPSVDQTGGFAAGASASTKGPLCIPAASDSDSGVPRTQSSLVRDLPANANGKPAPAQLASCGTMKSPERVLSVPDSSRLSVPQTLSTAATDANLSKQGPTTRDRSAQATPQGPLVRETAASPIDTSWRHKTTVAERATSPLFAHLEHDSDSDDPQEQTRPESPLQDEWSVPLAQTLPGSELLLKGLDAPAAVQDERVPLATSSFQSAERAPMATSSFQSTERAPMATLSFQSAEGAALETAPPAASTTTMTMGSGANRSALLHAAPALVTPGERAALKAVIRALPFGEQPQGQLHPLLRRVLEVDAGLLIEAGRDVVVGPPDAPAEAVAAALVPTLQPLSRALEQMAQRMRPAAVSVAQALLVVQDQLAIASLYEEQASMRRLASGVSGALLLHGAGSGGVTFPRYLKACARRRASARGLSP